MPTYEYRCLDCRKRLALYQRYEDYGHVAGRLPALRQRQPAAPHRPRARRPLG